MGVSFNFEKTPDFSMFRKPHSLKAKSFFSACMVLPFIHPYYLRWSDQNYLIYVFGVRGKLEFTDNGDGPFWKPGLNRESNRFIKGLEQCILQLNPKLTRLFYSLESLRNTDSPQDRIVKYKERIKRPYFVLRQYPLWGEEEFFAGNEYTPQDVLATLPDALTAWTMFEERIYSDFQAQLKQAKP